MFRLTVRRILAILMGCLFILHLAGAPVQAAPANAGVVWTQATGSAAFGIRSGAQCISFQNKMWLIGGGYPAGYYNDVWTSEDGKNWTQVPQEAPYTNRAGHNCFVFNDKIWMIGGYNSTENKNDIWSSPDGKFWTKLATSDKYLGRHGIFAVVFKNKIWLIGRGAGNEIYSSTNGTSWTLETDKPAFSARSYQTCVVFNNHLWMIGGYAETSQYEYSYINEIWSSSDGVTWQQATPTNGFPGRGMHACLVYDNKIWVIGGLGGNTGNARMNDVWWSSDGAVWHQATAAAGFTGRNALSSVVFDDKMWIMGGYDGHSTRNDVWYSPSPQAAVPALGWTGY